MPRAPRWPGITSSVVVHAALVLAILLGFHASPSQDQAAARDAAVPRVVDMVYIPPPRQAPVPPPQEAARPAPEPAPTPPAEAQPEQPPQRPRPNAVQADRNERESAVPTPKEEVPALTPREGASDMASNDVDRKGEGSTDPAPTLTSRGEPVPGLPPAPDSAARVDSEVQRIFGPRSGGVMARLGIGPDASLDNNPHPERTTCVPRPRPAGAEKEMVELVGRVYTPSHQPLPGAFLQIIGTPYSTFSDQSGTYRLTFDAALVDNCRTQFVRVVADGYRGRNLILGMGPGDTDVLLGRN